MNLKDYSNIDEKYYNLHYHIVFCDRYRRKIFTIKNLEARFFELVEEICTANDMQLIKANCDTDYYYLFTKASPRMNSAGAIAKIKGYTERKLLSEFEEFSKTQNLWTRNYLVSTEAIKSDSIQQFRNKQVTHY